MKSANVACGVGVDFFVTTGLGVDGLVVAGLGVGFVEVPLALVDVVGAGTADIDSPGVDDGFALEVTDSETVGTGVGLPVSGVELVDESNSSNPPRANDDESNDGDTGV